LAAGVKGLGLGVFLGQGSGVADCGDAVVFDIYSGVLGELVALALRGEEGVGD
jgi:hypothetical protein